MSVGASALRSSQDRKLPPVKHESSPPRKGLSNKTVSAAVSRSPSNHYRHNSIAESRQSPKGYSKYDLNIVQLAASEQPRPCPKIKVINQGSTKAELDKRKQKFARDNRSGGNLS